MPATPGRRPRHRCWADARGIVGTSPNLSVSQRLSTALRLRVKCTLTAYLAKCTRLSEQRIFNLECIKVIQTMHKKQPCLVSRHDTPHNMVKGNPPCFGYVAAADAFFPCVRAFQIIVTQPSVHRVVFTNANCDVCVRICHQPFPGSEWRGDAGPDAPPTTTWLHVATSALARASYA